MTQDDLLERHHLDLANMGQAGPVWHLQYGGNPAGNVAKLPTSWLNPPRWPSAPVDVTLLAELIAYNFFPHEWEELNRRGEWIRLICAVEQLVVSHFADFITNHFAQAPNRRDRTWLSAQDNLREELNPRPQ